MKNHILGTVLLSLFFLAAVLPATGQAKYGSYSDFDGRVMKLATAYPNLCTVTTIGKTLSGKDIRVIAVGTGNKDSKPALAVVGGIEAGYRLGKEISLGFAEALLKDFEKSEVKALLEKVTFYVIPDVTPDGWDFFAKPVTERSVNTRSTDEDRDFAYDEDPAEDLDGDGYITSVRIEDPSGTWIQSSEDPRIMVAADLSKGEKGKYRVYTEGTDNDKDGLFNEDGKGGVNFNRNFTFNYEEYGLNSGIHAISEPEVKAVADFLYDHFNIYAVISFGPQDNLGAPMKASERAAATQGDQQPQGMQGAFTGRMQGDRRITSVLKSDETINKLVSEKYREITGLKGTPPVKNNPGNFMEWAYYHYGRYSFSTPGWWITGSMMKNQEAALLKFASDNKLQLPFSEWKEISHPDFQGKKAEAGGIRPFALITPPDTAVQALVQKNSNFIRTVAALHPELRITDIRTENLGEGIFRLSLRVINTGTFATCAEVGDFNQWTRIMRLTLEPSASQSLLSGQKVQRIRRLEGGQSVEYSWLISGKGTVTVTAGAANTGTVSASADIK